MNKKSSNLRRGRFIKAAHVLTDEFNASISFDKRLFRHDIKGSIAHARGLGKAKILTKKEMAKIIKGLDSIEKEIAFGKFSFTLQMEDIHMAIEKRLIEKIGVIGGKLHTGRSRNDQIALDMRLYLKDEIMGLQSLIKVFQGTLFELAKKNIDVIMPGYTHLQRAQPILFSHHLLAYYEMLKRDSARLDDCLRRVDSMPLGSGALAGTPYNINRRYIARLLGFSSITENSIDAVSDRDFVIEFLSFSTIFMMHMSRLSEELVLWSSSEFGFVELSDAFSTGSSIMPQKKNPDVAELARGKTGRIYGNLLTLLTVMKALPLSYNKDMQEDKEALFDTVDTVKEVLRVFPPMLKTMRINKKAMLDSTKKGFLTATDAADYLVKKGMPFRKSHEVMGRVVRYCIEKSKTLEDLTVDEWQRFSPLFKGDIKKTVSVENSVNARKTHGATATNEARKQLKKIEGEIKRQG